MVDATDRRRGVMVPQQRARQATFPRLGVERDQQRRFFTRQVDLFHAGPRKSCTSALFHKWGL
ncbi:hypothetical protein D3C85_1705950 [compost metagenome]